MTDLETKSQASSSPTAAHAPPSWGWLRWAWRNLTSMRTAVILLALLALAAIPGSLFPQRNVASDPAAVINYMQEQPAHLAPWLDRLGMFDVYASPWFAAIYVLLLVSMTGCVLPRSRRLWQSVRSDPPPAPRNLARLEDHRSWATRQEPAEVIATAAAHLRSKGFRVVATEVEVRAERGYLREVGNLAFHLSLLVFLVGIAAGKLVGFEGRVAVAEGGTFANDVSQYDAFSPSAWTDVNDLEPVSFTLKQFDVAYQTSGPNTGQPTEFAAELAYRAGDGEEQTATVEPNHPLDVNETKFFLTGNGYAPVVTVRDGRGQVVFTGPVLFLPLDADFASEGVIKVPDAQPTQLAFEGLFLPTAAVGSRGPYSTFPDTIDPQLFLTAYTGDLGLGDGVPQSVFTLDKDQLDQVRRDGAALQSSALGRGDHEASRRTKAPSPSTGSPDSPTSRSPTTPARRSPSPLQPSCSSGSPLRLSSAAVGCGSESEAQGAASAESRSPATRSLAANRLRVRSMSSSPPSVNRRHPPPPARNPSHDPRRTHVGPALRPPGVLGHRCLRVRHACLRSRNCGSSGRTPAGWLESVRATPPSRAHTIAAACWVRWGHH